MKKSENPNHEGHEGTQIEIQNFETLMSKLIKV